MRTGAMVIATLLCLGLTMAVPAEGQDFEQLLQAVDKLEANLQARVEKESRQRQQAVEELRAEIAQARTGSVDSAELDRLTEGLARLKAERSQTIDSEWQTSIEKQVAGLRKRIDELAGQQQSPIPDITQEELAQLTADIAWLKAENTRLQEMIEGGQQFASTDEMAIPGADQHQVDQLTQRLTTLNAQLEQVIAEDRKEPAAEHHEPEPHANVVGGVAISGFFDVVSEFHPSHEDHNDFGLGQAEIDLASELADNVAVEAAIAYNADDGVFELGAALIGINLYGGEAFLSSLDITAGQFDVPFGIEWHEYPSIEGALVTGPSVVHYTHDGWNDVGFQFGLEATHGNFVFYAVNGFESSVEVLDEAATLEASEDVYEEVDTSPANAIGTRIGIAPFSWLEAGSSMATGWNVDGKSEMAMVGADLQFHMAGFELRGEYIAHSVNRSIAEANNRGYYAHLTYEFLHKAYVTTRYGSFKAEHHDWHGQSSIGGGYMLNDAVTLRFEQVLDENSDQNRSIMQIVTGF